MQLKNFQVTALEQISSFARRLSQQEKLSLPIKEFCRQAGHPVPEMAIGKMAWDSARSAEELPPGTLGWVELKDGLKREVPSVCLKVPTGGGKTLIGAHAIGHILSGMFERKTGLVVWVVPSEAILSQTIRAFTDPKHPYRAALEHAADGRLRVLTKNDRFALDDVVNGVCMVVVMLQSTVREEAAALRVFRDTGGFDTFFPQLDDVPANAEMLRETPNLDRIQKSTGSPDTAVRHSLANVLRLCRPLLVIDEGHRAYTDLARCSLLGLNPGFILELTATPNMQAHRSNVLVNVGGIALRNEGLIKLPINVDVNLGDDWKAVVRRAMKVRDEIEATALQDQKSTGRYIRPIALIRVEATGITKQGDKRVHANDVKKYLQKSLKIPDSWIRLKTSRVNEIVDEDLLSPSCQVRVILTKDALREGWDCPFAYVLAVLTATTGPTAITQMVGRVLRQPYAQPTSKPALNEAFVVCLTADVQRAVDAVSRGLQEEGLADVANFIRVGGSGDTTNATIPRSKVLKGDYFLPVVATRSGIRWELFDPERDLLRKIDYATLALPDFEAFKPVLVVGEARATIGLVDVAGKLAVRVSQTSGTVPLSTLDDYSGAVEVLRAVVPNGWLAYEFLRKAEGRLLEFGFDAANLATVRLQLAEFLRGKFSVAVDKRAEEMFRAAIASGNLRLIASPIDGIGVAMPTSLGVRRMATDRPLNRSNGKPLVKNVFADVFESQLNSLETAVVRELDSRPETIWWWRVPVKEEWSLVGWRRERIYPDLVVKAKLGISEALIVLETKGDHLIGSDDTTYKQAVIDLLQSSACTDKGAPTPKETRVGHRVLGAVLQEANWQTGLDAVLERLTAEPAS